jgi:hypothetical protein
MKLQTMTAKRYLEERYDAGRRCFADMTQEERQMASGYLIRDESTMAVVETITEGDAYNLGLMLSRCLISQTTRVDKEFAAAFRKDVATRYESTIDELFDEIAEDYQFESKFSAPYDKDERYYKSVIPA